MGQSQRALELRKFFTPFNPASALGCQYGNTADLNSDGALNAFAETVVWRLRGVRAMVSLIDYETQYFIAGATRSCGEDVESDALLCGFQTSTTPKGLCENTLAVNATMDVGEYPCFEVHDLAADSRFAHMPIVNGTIETYRFYAGAPIVTSYGVSIGTVFMFDDKPRPEGLTLSQRKHLCNSAAHVMRHLETKREGAERRRLASMSKGIATFLERTSQPTEEELETPGIGQFPRFTGSSSGSTIETPATSEPSEFGHKDKKTKVKAASEIVLDKIKQTLDQAAIILRESLELTAGGVLFLDTAMGHNESAVVEDDYFEAADIEIADERSRSDSIVSMADISPGLIRSFDDQDRPAKVLALSACRNSRSHLNMKLLDSKALQTFINVYPKGNIWYTDELGCFSSLEQVAEEEISGLTTPLGKRRLAGPFDVARQRSEGELLSKVFKKARQIVFLPLWDAGGNRWHSGCFVWSELAVPVFIVESDLAFLSTFTNSVMVEISRLDALTANKMKSNFISSISHEFRSPLHGILASAEFLRESDLDHMQMEFISTIQNCGSTLLDTINHVLDYSKINSFEKRGGDNGNLTNELDQISNVALLCEDIVNGMIAAREFQGLDDNGSNRLAVTGLEYTPCVDHDHKPQVEIILDFEHRDWDFKIRPGALRRIIMNIFGNALKYTQTGFISIQLRIHEVPESETTPAAGPCKRNLVLNIIDSGRGMSTQYMERKLYTPFAQEDSFAPGVGLGLSIVWSIVSQLGGKIQIRSEMGKGTNVEIVLPLETDAACGAAQPSKKTMDSTKAGDADARHCLDTLKQLTKGKTVAIVCPPQTEEHPRRSLAWEAMERYCESWFGLIITPSHDEHALAGTDLVIMSSTNQDNGVSSVSYSESNRVLLVRENISCPRQRAAQRRGHAEFINTPLGPYKLARTILPLFQSQSITPRKPESSTSDDVALSTPSSASTPIVAVHSVDVGLAQDIPKPHLYTTEQTSSGQTSSQQEISTLEPLAQTPSQNFTTIPRLLALKSPQTQPLHVLAVDDNTLNLQLLHRYLLKRPQDFITTATNGLEAVAAVRAALIPFDVIFMDISMPEMDGFEATRIIRLFERSLRHREPEEVPGVLVFNEDEKLFDGLEVCGKEIKDDPLNGEGFKVHNQHTYIVALTGLASRRDRDEAEESGFDEFFTKPISFAKIGQLLSRLSREKLVCD